MDVVYFNSVGQELKVGDKVVYDDLLVKTENGIYSPSVKITRNYIIGKILSFKELKQYTKAVIEYNVWEKVETREVNVKYLIKI